MTNDVTNFQPTNNANFCANTHKANIQYILDFHINRFNHKYTLIAIKIEDAPFFLMKDNV